MILCGFLLQGPTLLTLLMFPILVTMYVRLARREEREVLAEFGEVYARYAAGTPAFFPRLGRAARHAWAEEGDSMQQTQIGLANILSRRLLTRRYPKRDT
jgi:hypothetical protein